MLIRHAEPARDGGACAAIYAPYVLETAISFEEEPPSPPELERRIETISARFPWLVAEAGGAVIGYAYASAHRERAAYRWAAEVAVYVDRSHQRQGAGLALYRALLEDLQRQGFHMACAGITLPNDASVALHEACGFQPVGVFRSVGWKLGAWHDVGWWQRELRAPEPRRPAEPGPPT
ncbi:MAG TPA: arsinothricin resistance N-acetyltransferase ArsN1 family B [Solirubrobacteraceae bacterium]|nr:arsinothricin resistance N-acetyltransferase ArsN1 family B [Solirubrobacteraceae bacterium]